MTDRIKLWKKLLNKKRLGNKDPYVTGDPRSEFEKDYNRIVFSSAFRRLQDKTQVFPLSQTDYSRTRLTHSIEVSCVGMSLGTRVEQSLIEQSILAKDEKHDLSTIVAAASLAHDIGNPPFGHSGEDAIRHWAEKKLSEHSEILEVKNFREMITNTLEQQDFLQFEGNSQTFRIFARLQGREKTGGLQLTYATLGALFKYPRPSKIEDNKAEKDQIQANTDMAGFKKPGYFHDDRELALGVFRELGLRKVGEGIFARHPLAFLMEAADDICYAVVDLEDAWHQGIISFKEIQNALMPLIPDDKQKQINQMKEEATKVIRMRGDAINNLTSLCADVFTNNLIEIENGAFQSTLIKDVPLKDDYAELKKVAVNKVYSNERVLQVEYAGYNAIGGLLEIFGQALMAESPNLEEKKLLSLFPEQFLCFESEDFELEKTQLLQKLTPYQRLLSATDYISGMTDRYAIDLYQKLSGIKLPS